MTLPNIGVKTTTNSDSEKEKRDVGPMFDNASRNSRSAGSGFKSMFCFWQNKCCCYLNYGSAKKEPVLYLIVAAPQSQRGTSLRSCAGARFRKEDLLQSKIRSSHWYDVCILSKYRQNYSASQVARQDT